MGERSEGVSVGGEKCASTEGRGKRGRAWVLDEREEGKRKGEEGS